MRSDHYILARAKSASYGSPVYRIAARHVANRKFFQMRKHRDTAFFWRALGVQIREVST